MTVASRIADRILDLPPALTRRITVHRDIDVPARDGTILRTDVYVPLLPHPTATPRPPARPCWCAPRTGARGYAA